MANNTQIDTIRTTTQYDKTLDYLYKDYPNAKRGVAGPVFAIVTASNYLRSGILTKEVHEMNLNRAVTISSILAIKNDLALKTLVDNTNLSTNLNNTIMHTEVNKTQITNIIPDIVSGRFCTIIHKNHKYFVVIGDTGSNKYCVRDCNEPCQYNFSVRTDLIKHLNDIYYLNKEFTVDGQIVPGFSSIEYIIINNVFTDNFDQQIERIILNGNNNANNANINNINNKVNVNINTGSAFIGYVNNVPNDNVDIAALQRQFGDGDDYVHRYLDNENLENADVVLNGKVISRGRMGRYNDGLSDDDYPTYNRKFSRKDIAFVLNSTDSDDSAEIDDDDDDYFNDD